MKGTECNMKRTLREMNAKWNEMKGNERKGHEKKWLHLFTSIDFQAKMLSHPQKAGKITFLVKRAHTTWENGTSNKNDNMIWVFRMTFQMAFKKIPSESGLLCGAAGDGYLCWSRLLSFGDTYALGHRLRLETSFKATQDFGVLRLWRDAWTYLFGTMEAWQVSRVAPSAT